MDTNATEKKEKRIPYSVNIEEHIEFNADFEGKYISSVEFCKRADEIFKVAFINFYGVKFVISNPSNPNMSPISMQLYFTHLDDFDPKVVDGVAMNHVATARIASLTTNSSTIDRMRYRDTMAMNGDKYHLTDDGKDIIMPLLHSRLYNSGKPNWANLVTEISDNSNYYNLGKPVQLTQVSGIDPARVASMIWGKRSDHNKDDILDYGVSVMRNMSINAQYGMPGVGGGNYVLMITKAHTNEVKRTYEKLGLGSIGSSIITSD